MWSVPFCATLAALFSKAFTIPTTSDWKHAVGWDGVVVSATGIGHPLENDTARDAHNHARGHVGGIYLCVDINWGGRCGYAVQPLDDCIVLGTDWNNKISSLGPDPGTIVVVFDDSKCGGPNPAPAPAISFPGLAGLDNWNDRISSFRALAQ